MESLGSKKRRYRLLWSVLDCEKRQRTRNRYCGACKDLVLKEDVSLELTPQNQYPYCLHRGGTYTTVHFDSFDQTPRTFRLTRPNTLKFLMPIQPACAQRATNKGKSSGTATLPHSFSEGEPRKTRWFHGRGWTFVPALDGASAGRIAVEHRDW